MKALAATGDPTLVRFVEVTEPTAAPDAAVIRVEAFSVNRGEILAMTGAYGTPTVPGTVMGQDVVGRVVAAAADGSGPAVGTRVVGHAEGGGWAERVAVPTSALAELPDTLAATSAAALPLAGLTALRLLRHVEAPAGKQALITGASGGVGHYLVELATAAGISVTAVAASPERGARLAELGAAVVHDVADADGRFDVIFESVGGDVFAAALARIAPGGTVLWFGQASLQPIRLSFFEYLAVTPFTLRHFPHWVADTTDAEDLRVLVDLTATGRLHPELGRVADWAETASVLTDLNNRRIRGNAILTIA
ncbi:MULTISPECIES: zinc-binding dehydrogenase [unclassified Nocardia]|uniref:zinc-binding dehydrogenase n=1 Tax=unclassified Nocardia TaxID=2637762 RepID=UPI00342D5CB4